MISSCLLPCLCAGCSSPRCTMWQWRGGWDWKILGRSSSLDERLLNGDWRMLFLHSTHVHYHSLCLHQPNRGQWWASLIGMGKVLEFFHQCSRSKKCSHCWRSVKWTKSITELIARNRLVDCMNSHKLFCMIGHTSWLIDELWMLCNCHHPLEVLRVL